jgi:hypothetical protein
MPTITITPGWAGPLSAVGSAPLVVQVAGVGPPGPSGSATAIGATVAGGTPGRVLFVGTGPVLADDSGLTFNTATDALTVTGAVNANGGVLTGGQEVNAGTGRVTAGELDIGSSNLTIDENGNVVTAGTVTGNGSGITGITAFGGMFQTIVTDGTTPIISSVPKATTVVRLRGLRTAAGTVTLALQINGVSITGVSAVAVTTTPQTVTASGSNAMAVGDRLTQVLTSASGASGLEYTLEIVR